MENNEENKIVANKKVIVYNTNPLPSNFWNEWNEVCSKLNEYFDNLKNKQRKRSEKPKYKDSHSVLFQEVSEMVNNENKFYTIQKNNEDAPEWFHNECAAGRIRLFYDGEYLEKVTVFTTTKTVVGKIGDVIVKSRTGMNIIPKDKAKKYKVR